MQRPAILFVFMAFLGQMACDKETNKASAPDRRYEDTLSLSQILAEPLAATAQSDFDNWLSLYPESVGQVMLTEGSTALGVVARAYFENDPSFRPAYYPFIKKLLAAGADPNVLFPVKGAEIKRGLIHMAAEQRDQELIQFLIDENGSVTPAPQIDCESAAAAQTRQTSKDRPALDINFRESESGVGRTALHYAVSLSDRSPGMVQFLLTLGANPNIAADPEDSQSTALSLAEDRPELLGLMQVFSGAQLRFDSELRGLIDQRLTISAKPDNRLTLAALEASFELLANSAEYAEVLDFNRSITSCVSGEKLNILAYAARYLIPDPMKVPLQWTVRNRTLASWFAAPRKALLCSGDITIKQADATFSPETPKALLRNALIAQSAGGSPALKNANRTLWCNTIAAQAEAEGCWTSEDAQISPDFICP